MYAICMYTHTHTRVFSDYTLYPCALPLVYSHLPPTLMPTTPRTHQSPSQIHDIWFLLLWSYLVWPSMTICATIGLGLPTGTWWGHQWVHNWRWWIILSLNLSVVNSSRVGDGSPPQALLLQTNIQRPFLMQTQCQGCCCEFGPCGWIFPRGKPLQPSSVF